MVAPTRCQGCSVAPVVRAALCLTDATAPGDAGPGGASNWPVSGPRPPLSKGKRGHFGVGPSDNTHRTVLPPEEVRVLAPKMESMTIPRQEARRPSKPAPRAFDVQTPASPRRQSRMLPVHRLLPELAEPRCEIWQVSRCPFLKSGRLSASFDRSLSVTTTDSNHVAILCWGERGQHVCSSPHSMPRP